MDLQDYIKTLFPGGLKYDDAVQLCLRLFCTVDDIPNSIQPECTKTCLADAFATLACNNFLKGDCDSADKYGASMFETTDREHWIMVLNSLFAGNEVVNHEVRRYLDEKIKG